GRPFARARAPRGGRGRFRLPRACPPAPRSRPGCGLGGQGRRRVHRHPRARGGRPPVLRVRPAGVLTSGAPMPARNREAHELLLIEEADAWFEYADATKGQLGGRYAEIEPWAWARLQNRLRAIRARRARLTVAEAA